MAVIKKNIRMNKMKGKIISQITLDDDVNVSDRLPDIGHKITETGEIIVDSVKASQNKIAISGKLNFKIMYKAQAAEVDIHKLEGNMNFDEIINMEGIEDGDTISVDLSIDDLSIDVINSRKISVKAVITVVAIAENISDEEFVVELEDSSIEYIKEPIELTRLAVKKKDLLRVREEINLVSGKLNINELIWNTANLSKQQIKLAENKVLVSGEIAVFILYSAEEGPLQWVDINVPFSGAIDVPGCSEEMIPQIELKLKGAEIEAKPDLDGEQRMFSLDGIVNVDIKLYEEHCFDVVKDAYSKSKDIILKDKKIDYEALLTKNITKGKVNEKFQINSLENVHIMQICSTVADVKLDDTSLRPEGIMVEGVLDISVLYICSDDANPLRCMHESIPFSQMIEINDIKENSVFNIRGMLEQISANMAGSDEIEIKGVILLDCTVFDKMKKNVVMDYEEKEYDMEKIANMPGIVGYICKSGDTLWSIAKKFYTSVDCIKNINEITDNPKEGQMLIIVKQMG